MKFISICSGIEAASLASKHLGWQAVAFSEIEPFPCAVLQHRYPEVPNLGDMTCFRDWPEQVFADADAIVGGPPCQAYSVAGNREGLNDQRGNLTLIYNQIIDHADRIREKHGLPPVVTLYENVPGLLSDATGAFGCFLAGLAGERDPIEPGPRPKPGRSSAHWRWKKESGLHVPCWPVAGVVAGPRRTVAWRVVDAQYFGLAQRRERVFVVASARNGFSPGRVLFESEGVRRDTAPSRKEGEDVAPCVTAGASGSGAAHRSRSGSGKEGLIVPVGSAQIGSRHNSHWNGGPHPPLSQASQTRCGGIGASNQEIFEQGGAGLVPVSTEVGTALPVSHANGVGQGGAEVLRDRCPTLTCNHEAPIVAYDGPTHTLRADGFDASEDGFDASEDGTGRGTPLIPVVFDTTNITSATNRSNPQAGDPCHTLAAGAHPPAIAFAPKAGGKQTTLGYDPSSDTIQTLSCTQEPAVHIGMAVRRLIPRECERLQGMPDDHTLIPIKKGAPKPLAKVKATIPVFDTMAEAMQPVSSPRDKAHRFALNCGDGKAQIYAMAADGPRYKAIGNSWAVFVVSWILERISQEVRRSEGGRHG